MSIKITVRDESVTHCKKRFWIEMQTSDAAAMCDMDGSESRADEEVVDGVVVVVFESSSGCEDERGGGVKRRS